MDLAVEDGRADDDQASGGDDGAAIVLAAAMLHPLTRVRITPERHLPEIASGVQVDGVQRPPGWRDRRKAVLVSKVQIPGKTVAVHLGDLRGHGTFKLIARAQKSHQVHQVVAGDACRSERGHTTLSCVDQSDYLIGCPPRLYALQAGKPRRDAFEMLTVT